jgi:peptide chain release factor 2
MKPGFWENDESREVGREIARIQAVQVQETHLAEELGEIETLDLMLEEGEDRELEREFEARASSLEEDLDRRILESYMDGGLDRSSALLSVHSGAGGLDSQDWAEMLVRMYLRFAEKRGFGVKLLDELPDVEAGIKSATYLIEGEHAYGWLKGEAGVHRLVRISPFDAAKRRHTSFASVEVVPELPDDVEVEIRPEDLKMDTYRSSGAGGQYVNKTDSAVRLTHLPTGIVVACQVERSQHMNRATAMRMLRAKLFERTLRERQERLEGLQGEKRVIAWGSQIRSYTLQPFQLVKDHRSGLEVGNVQAVLDGDLDALLTSALKAAARGRGASEAAGE